MKDIGLMKGPKSEPQKLMEKILANREWLDQNITALISQYRTGEWIAISGQKVVSKGDTSETVIAALGGTIGEALIIQVPDKDIPLPF
jgi:hypothetical protein